MKKLTLSILIFLLSISFVACSSANTPSQGSSASESTDSNSSNNASSNNSSSSNNNSNSGENTTLNDTSFKIGVDDQPFNLSRAGMSASNESGDYMFYLNTLYFHDNAANTTVIACNKPDCDHITNVDDGESDCNAFFPQDKYYYDKGFSYYNDSIYLLGKSSKDAKSVSLYKISKDASTREEVAKLISVSDLNSITVFAVHKGYAFWSLNTDKSAQLLAINIDKPTEVKKIFEGNELAAGIHSLIGSGDYLYFSNSYSEDKNYENWAGYINQLDINTLKTKKLMDMPDDYTVANGKIYYLESNALYCYTIDSDSSVKIADSPENSQLIIRDTDYLYLTNWDNEKVSSDNYKVFVMSTNGNIIDTIPIPDCEFFRGGLHNLYIDTTDRKVKYLEKSQIQKGTHNWSTAYSVSENGQVTLNE